PGQEAALAWARERFLDEAKTLAKLQDPSILPVFDYFEDNGTAYLISPFIEGQTLEDWFAKRGTPSEGELCAILRTLLNALKKVHECTVLHRDIKPENILMERKGEVPVLIDFGNARVASGLKTSNLSAILTPGYAPFEQYQTDGKQGPWTDLYALGAVLYRAVTGKVPPWSTDRQGNDTIVRLAHNPSIKGYSPPFLTMIDKALRLRREERWQSCAEWLAALDRLTPPPTTPKTKPRFGFAVTAVASVVVVGGGLAYLLKSDSTTPPPPPPPRPTNVPLIAIEQPTGFALSHGQAVVDFGRPSINATVPKTFVIKNTGLAELSGLLITKDGSNDFSIAPLNTTSVAAGKITEFAVNFTPRESGSQKATLHITSNSAEGKSPFDINLTGGGVGTPDISIEQDGKVLVDNSSALNFGSVTVGATSEVKLFTIKSIGTADLAGLAANVDGADYKVSALSSGAVAPGRTATFSVIFKPSASGERSATLHLASNASGAKNPFDLNFTGSGQPLPPPRPDPPKPPEKAAVVGNGPIENFIGMKFVPVEVTDPVGTAMFSVYETTKEDYKRIVPSYESKGDPSEPVVGLTDDEVNYFLRELSKRDGHRHRLPTDHEWSCAIGLHERAADPLKVKKKKLDIYPWGPDPLKKPKSLNYSNPGHFVPVKESGETLFGLFGMAGNAAEMCVAGDGIVLRGGSCYTTPIPGASEFTDADSRMRAFAGYASANRESITQTSEKFDTSDTSNRQEVGFRCVREP
ncbi:MAG: protein kinase domain-containing protein, partial [Verrucomicrobiaceae bacterium]